MQGGVGNEFCLWRRHLHDKEVRAVVVVVRRADLDVVVAIVLGRDQVEPSDRAEDVALRDAEGIVELRDAGVLEPGVRSWSRQGRRGGLVASMRSVRSTAVG